MAGGNRCTDGTWKAALACWQLTIAPAMPISFRTAHATADYLWPRQTTPNGPSHPRILPGRARGGCQTEFTPSPPDAQSTIQFGEVNGQANREKLANQIQGRLGARLDWWTQAFANPLKRLRMCC